jgi:Uma2 family endonuclease
MNQAVLDYPTAEAITDDVSDEGEFTLDLSRVLKLTEEKFLTLCADNRDLRFEMTAEGKLIVMSPCDWVTSARNSKITKQLTIWADEDGQGIALESSSGFMLPNKARRGPDAAWVSRERIRNLPPEKQKGLLPLAPEFVIELRSSTDSLKKLQRKLEEYLA